MSPKRQNPTTNRHHPRSAIIESKAILLVMNILVLTRLLMMMKNSKRSRRKSPERLERSVEESIRRMLFCTVAWLAPCKRLGGENGIDRTGRRPAARFALHRIILCLGSGMLIYLAVQGDFKMQIQIYFFIVHPQNGVSAQPLFWYITSVRIVNLTPLVTSAPECNKPFC